MIDRRHAELIGRNEVLFRQVNERLDPQEADPQAPIAFLCECGQLGCTETVILSQGDYQAVRVDFERFLLIPGHQVPEVETVIEDHGHYVVAVKQGIAAQAAAAEMAADQSGDPRDDRVHGR